MKKIIKKYALKMLFKILDCAKGNVRITSYYDDDVTPKEEQLYIDGELLKKFRYNEDGKLDHISVIFNGNIYETVMFHTNGMIKLIEFNYMPGIHETTIFEWDENGTCIRHKTPGCSYAKFTEPEAFKIAKFDAKRI